MSRFISVFTLLVFSFLTLIGCKEQSPLRKISQGKMGSSGLSSGGSNASNNSPSPVPAARAVERQYIGYLDRLANMEDPSSELEIGSVIAYKTEDGRRTFPNLLRIVDVLNRPTQDLSQAISISKVEPQGGPTFYLVGFKIQERYDDRTTAALEAHRLSGDYIDIYPAVRAHSFEMALKPDAAISVLRNSSNFGSREIHSSSAGALISMHLTLDKAGGEFIEKVMAGSANFSDKFEVRACFEVDAAVPRSQADIDADPGPYVFTVQQKRVTKCAVMEQ